MGVVVSLPDQPPAAGIENLLALTKDDMGRVNDMIFAKCGSDVDMIPEVARHLVDSGGKRLRPMITLAAAQMFGYEGDGHVKLAFAVEFMHTATLLHDDVVDESDLRRSKPTARMIWGNQASVLVGDFLLGQAFRVMVETGSLDALDVLSSAATIIAEGEVMQLAAAKKLTTTEDEYMQVVRSKTAALFEAAGEVGPIIAGKGHDERAALKSYGLNLGLAFQIVDDVLDYGGNASDLGKNVGDDFREGKITLPVLLAYRRGSEDERKFWAECIEQGKTDDHRLEHARGLMRRHNALADTIQRARHFGEVARDALAPLPQNAQRDALLEVVEYCISRLN
ncbi:MAG: polyprenyl synthetase family protein [Pseudomonadota bacterium]